MSRYSKNARKVVKPSLKDAEYLSVEQGYNVFQRSDARGYTAISVVDRNIRCDVGSMAEVVDWIAANAA